MTIARIIILCFAGLTIGGAWTLASAGVWGEDKDAVRSVRTGSAGGGYLGGRVK